MIEKGTLKVGDRLEGKHKGTTYHALVQAANGDGSLVFKAEDGPGAGKQFTTLSALAGATGSVRNGWTFWSLAGKTPAKAPRTGGRPAKPKAKTPKAPRAERASLPARTTGKRQPRARVTRQLAEAAA